MRVRPTIATASLVFLLPATLLLAQDEQAERDGEDARLGWSNSTELSLVATGGNSETLTFGLKNTLGYRWSNASYTLRFDGLRSDNADDKYYEILPFEGDPATSDLDDLIRLVEPERKLDAEKYLIENIYQRELSDHLVWNIGFTWDRNSDANILNRYVGFVGLGHVWFDRDDLRFETSYGISYTDRNEENPDPEKDAEFPGARLAVKFSRLWGKTTTTGNNSTFVGSLSDLGDWNLDTSTWVSVAMNNHLALKATLQFLYNSLPALEDADVLFLAPSGTEVDFGTLRFRKERLDTVFTSSLVVSF